MQNKLRILLVGLITWLTASVSANIITATVESKTSAEITGDETGRVTADFYTTGNYKDRLTEGNKAVMTLANLPDGTIEYVTLYMHSNKAAGAGTMTLAINGLTVAYVSDRKFSEWPGLNDFTTDYVPVYFSGSWEIEDGATMQLTISSSANSLYFSKMEISLSAGEAKARTVTFNWNTPEGDKQTTMTEPGIGAGIILPQCQLQAFALNGEEWTFAGWARDRVVALMKRAPEMLFPGKTFYPPHNTSLYAIYKTVSDETPVMQDTLYQSGIYALVMNGAFDTYYMAQGGVQDKKIATTTCDIQMQQDGRYRLAQNFVPTDSRYQIEFEDDRLTITTAIGSKPIGHTSTYLTENSTEWNWSKGLNHSVAMYFAPEVKDGVTSARTLMMDISDKSNPNTLIAMNVNLIDNYQYVLLFDVTDVPTVAQSGVWTSHPFGYEELSAISTPTSAKKVIRNGIMLIEKDGVLFDLQGRKYNN